jgi:type III pantothenate kinase
MLLAVDIGNTNIKFGLFRGDQLEFVWRIATRRDKLTDEYAVILKNLFSLRDLHLDQVRACAISSVVPPLTGVFRELCRTYLQLEPLLLDANLDLGMKLLIDRPGELGADRIAHAVAAKARYGGPAIIIEFGTATVFDMVSSDGDYLGGAIAPGLVLSSQALASAAAKLVQVEFTAPPSVIGKNTVQAMQSGIVIGYASLVEGMVRRLRAAMGARAVVIASGGMAKTIHEVLKGEDIIDHLDQHLVLEGLRLIHDRHDTAS